jgi:creatinine amidohydrolase/Fe(II)-dependent formamide hydrolase-like protein
MLSYFPDHVKAEAAKTLKPSRTTAEDLNVLRRGGDTARKMIPQGYIGDPAAFDIEAGKREVEEKAARYAEMIEREVSG